MNQNAMIPQNEYSSKTKTERRKGTHITGNTRIRILIPRPAKVRILLKQRQLPRPRHELLPHLVREAQARGAGADACYAELGGLGVVLLQDAVGGILRYVGLVGELFLWWCCRCGSGSGIGMVSVDALLEVVVGIGDGLVVGCVGHTGCDFIGVRSHDDGWLCV